MVAVRGEVRVAEARGGGDGGGGEGGGGNGGGEGGGEGGGGEGGGGARGRQRAGSPDRATRIANWPARLALGEQVGGQHARAMRACLPV